MPEVTAVIVCHDGADFLPRTLTALAAQTRAPDVVLAVDAGSTDGSAPLLSTATPNVLKVRARTSFGDAVTAALTSLSAVRATPQPDPRPEASKDGAEAATRSADRAEPTHWLWLLHDDAAPDPRVLELLLEAVETAPSVGIAGCKQVEWDNEYALRDVGFAVTRFGLKVTGVDRHEVDQGQHDDRCDVMAVGTAGMLVRRDVWERLRGPDPALRHARDDADLCRRAHLAGHRVIVVPEAVVHHAQAGAAGLRGNERRHYASWVRADRTDCVRMRLTGARWFAVPFVAVWVLLAAPVRAAWRLLIKQPRAAFAELFVPLLVLLRPLRLWRARRRTAKARRVPRSVLRGLYPTFTEVWRQRRDDLTAFLSWGPAQAEDVPAPTPGTAHARVAVGAVETGPVAEEAEDLDADSEGLRRAFARWSVPVLLFAGLSVVALFALKRIATLAAVPTSRVLLPAPQTAEQSWHAVISTWRTVGLGAPGTADPLDAVLAAGGWVAAGQPRMLITVLLCLAVPLAALSAWIATGALTRSRALRAWAAIVWAAGPPLLVNLSLGRLGPVVAHIALPLVVLGVARTAGWVPMATRRIALTVSSATGLGLAVLFAGAPSLAVPAALALVGALIFARRGRRLLLGWTVLVPTVLLLPWWAAVVQAPRLLLADPGVPASAGATAGAQQPWWALATVPGVAPENLLGGIDGTPAQWLARVAPTTTPYLTYVLQVVVIAAVVPVVFFAVKALLDRRRSTLARIACALGLAGLALALIAPRVVVAATPDGGAFGWAGPGTSLLLLGLLLAAVAGLVGVGGRARRAGGKRRLRMAWTGLVALVVVLLPAVSLGTWAWHATADGTADSDGADGGLTASAPDVLPGVAAVEARSALAQRTLVLRVRQGGVDWALERDAGPLLSDSSAALAEADLTASRARADSQVVVPVISQLLSDSGADLRPQLQNLAVASVLMLPPLQESAALAVDASPGMVRSGSTGGAQLWRVEPDAAGVPTSADREALAARRGARVRILAANGQLLGAVASPVPAEGVDVSARIPAGPPGRTLVLAERSDAGWTARLNRRPLTSAVHDGWAQAFELPASGGQLEVRYRVPGQNAADLGRAFVAVIAGLLALPLPRLKRTRIPPPRMSRPVGRTATAPDGEADVAGAPLGSPEAMDRWLAEHGDAAAAEGEESAENETPAPEAESAPEPASASGEGPAALVQLPEPLDARDHEPSQERS